jgi:hypothetical protein
VVDNLNLVGVDRIFVCRTSFFEFKAVDPATRLDRIECVITEMNHIKRRGSEAEAERSTRQDEERLVE